MSCETECEVGCESGYELECEVTCSNVECFLEFEVGSEWDVKQELRLVLKL